MKILRGKFFLQCYHSFSTLSGNGASPYSGTMTQMLLCSEYVINMIVTSYEKEDICIILTYCLDTRHTIIRTFIMVR